MGILHNVADSVNYLVDQFRGVVEQSRNISKDLHLKAEGLEGKEIESFRAKLNELQDLMAGFHLSQEEIDQADSIPIWLQMRRKTIVR